MPRIHDPLVDLRCPVLTDVRNEQCGWSIEAPVAEKLAPMSLVRLLGGDAGAHLRLSDTNRAELAAAEHLASHSPAEWLLTVAARDRRIEDLEDQLFEAQNPQPVDAPKYGDKARPNLGTGRR
jgi:hypothetical protein